HDSTTHCYSSNPDPSNPSPSAIKKYSSICPPSPEPASGVSQTDESPTTAAPISSAPEPEPFASAPEPESVKPELEPEPVASAPEPVILEPEPVASAPEPIILEPETVTPAPEPTILEPEPVASASEPEPEPVPEPVILEPQPEATEDTVIRVGNPNVTVSPEVAQGVVSTYYGYVAGQSWEAARSLTGGELAQQFNPEFFQQFQRVTVANLRVIRTSTDTIKLSGQNTYIYPDGTTQLEERTFTVQWIDGQPRIVSSALVRVIKARS
ncbi:MAG: hypothetical protein AB4042_07600, partial [Leptolyngbyaceae cyanobacterium]